MNSITSTWFPLTRHTVIWAIPINQRWFNTQGIDVSCIWGFYDFGPSPCSICLQHYFHNRHYHHLYLVAIKVQWCNTTPVIYE